MFLNLLFLLFMMLGTKDSQYFENRASIAVRTERRTTGGQQNAPDTLLELQLGVVSCLSV